MKKLVILVVFVLALTLVASASGTHISGRVSYSNGVAAEFVRVQLWSDSISFRTEANTDKQGKFDFVGVPNSTFHILIDVVGYQPYNSTVDISMNGQAYEDVVLRPKPGTRPPEAAATPATIDARIAAIPAEAKKEFDAGQQAVSSNNFTAAIPHLQKAVELYPKYAEAYQLLGLSQIQTQQGPQAEASLQQAIAIEPKMPQAQYLLGMLLAMTGRANLAEQPFTRFVDLDPSNPDAHFELAKTEFALNKFPDAEMHARKAIELKEKNPGVQVVLAYALLRQQKANEAKAAFQEFLKLDPNSPMKTDVEATIAQIDAHEKGAK